ncbi:MAG: HIG1 domain-containing protein [Sphingomonadales bacterium]
MSTPFLVIVGILAVALVVVLAMGVIGLAKNGGTNPRRSNRLMQARVAIQFAIILVLLLAAMMASR